MNVTSAIQTQYTAATNRTNNSREIEKRDEANRILPLDELIDEEGMEVLNNLLDGMSLSEEEEQGIKLALGFSLGIKSNEVVNGKLEIIREDRQLDFGTISNKLQKIAREEGQGGFLSQEIKEIANELISYYTSKIQENLSTKDSTIDDFLEDLYSGNSTATTTASTITKENIQNKVNEYAQTLMETRGDTPESKLEVSKLLNDYKKELLQDYKNSLDGATNNTITLQQEAIIKVLLDENTKEASSLEKLLSATDTITKTQATGRMSEMQEKYKDVYTPIPETYSKEDENIQFREIHEAYPNYIHFSDFLKIVDSFIEGPKIYLGQKLSAAEDKAQRADYDQAFQKAYDIFGGEEAFLEMQKGAMEIKQKYPVNTWGKDERVHNQTELARFTNAATYEALEQGKTVEEARIYAGNLRSSFMDTSYSGINFIETLIKAGRADQSALDIFLSQSQQERNEEAYEVDFNKPNNSTMDLREYGIEGNWEDYRVVESQQGMIAEINKKISQFNFMLNNESRIKEAYQKLDGSYHDLGNNAGYKKMINETYMPRMEDGLNIFKNYKIYN